MDHMPGVIDAVKRAYLDVRDVYEHLANLAIMALVLSLVVTAIGFFLAGSGLTFFAQIVRLVVHIAFGFVMAPYLIAAHRFILLREVTARYDLAPGDPRLQRFFGWTIVFALFGAAPAVLSGILPLPGLLRAVLTIGLAIGVVIVTLRLIIVLPAVAVDSDRVTWQNAMADTAGYAGRIFLIGLAAALPVAFAAAILAGFFASFGFGLLALVAVLIQGAAGVIIASLLVAIASRVYESLGDRVRA
jgi:hypothetical protein